MSAQTELLSDAVEARILLLAANLSAMPSHLAGTGTADKYAADRIRKLVVFALANRRASPPAEPTEEMLDSVRGILQSIRLNPGVTYAEVKSHCESRGDDLTHWPAWAGMCAGSYVTEQSAASLIYSVMRALAPADDARDGLKFSCYADDDEFYGVTIQDYVKQRNGPEWPADCWIGIGDDFYVTAGWSRTEKWRLIAGPTEDVPDAEIVCERIDASIAAEGR